MRRHPRQLLGFEAFVKPLEQTTEISSTGPLCYIATISTTGAAMIAISFALASIGLFSVHFSDRYLSRAKRPVARAADRRAL